MYPNQSLGSTSRQGSFTHKTQWTQCLGPMRLSGAHAHVFIFIKIRRKNYNESNVDYIYLYLNATIEYNF